jgi:hypothetical protein
MVKIALERNSCEQKRFCPQSLAIFFVLICQRNCATRRMSRISQISLSANALIGTRQPANNARATRVVVSAVATIFLRHIVSGATPWNGAFAPARAR